MKPNGCFSVSITLCWTVFINPDFDNTSVGHINLFVIHHLTPSAPITPKAPTARMDPNAGCVMDTFL